MSRRCELPICSKKAMVVTKRNTQKVNVQPFTLPDGTKVKACTTCIRTVNKSLAA
jgi:ribosomal protein L28